MKPKSLSWSLLWCYLLRGKASEKLMLNWITKNSNYSYNFFFLEYGIKQKISQISRLKDRVFFEERESTFRKWRMEKSRKLVCTSRASLSVRRNNAIILRLFYLKYLQNGKSSYFEKGENHRQIWKSISSINREN